MLQIKLLYTAEDEKVIKRELEKKRIYPLSTRTKDRSSQFEKLHYYKLDVLKFDSREHMLRLFNILLYIYILKYFLIVLLKKFHSYESSAYYLEISLSIDGWQSFPKTFRSSNKNALWVTIAISFSFRVHSLAGQKTKRYKK